MLVLQKSKLQKYVPPLSVSSCGEAMVRSENVDVATQVISLLCKICLVNVGHLRA